MSETYDVVVIGAGIVGASTAFHLAKLGCKRVLLLEREHVCAGGTARSCAIVRTHYSIPTNTRLAVASLEMFANFRDVLEHEAADCGFVRAGYLILAPEGPAAEALTRNLEMQQAVGATTRGITAAEARERHPLLALDDVAAIGYEPHSGYADPYLTTSAFANAARKRSVEVKPLRAVIGLRRAGGRVTAVETAGGDFAAGAVVVAIGPWSEALGRWTGLDLPLALSRHTVVTFGAPEPYEATLPVVKDLTTENKMYFRPATGGVALVGTGDYGEPIEVPSEAEGGGSMGLDFVALQGAQLARRVPVFAAGEFTDVWRGPYDITPDWNPVIGPLPGHEGLYAAFGFSGHGFKLAPALGRVLAQTALGLAPDVDLRPYRLERFAEGEPLTGAYGAGSIS